MAQLHPDGGFEVSHTNRGVGPLGWDSSGPLLWATAYMHIVFYELYLNLSLHVKGRLW